MKDYYFTITRQVMDTQMDNATASVPKIYPFWSKKIDKQSN